MGIDRRLESVSVAAPKEAQVLAPTTRRVTFSRKFHRRTREGRRRMPGTIATGNRTKCVLFYYTNTISVAASPLASAVVHLPTAVEPLLVAASASSLLLDVVSDVEAVLQWAYTTTHTVKPTKSTRAAMTSVLRQQGMATGARSLACRMRTARLTDRDA